MMEQLIRNIRNDEKIHFLHGYPSSERKKIIRRIKRNFKTDVLVIPGNGMCWEDIRNSKEKIKILVDTGSIINKHSLGKDFNSTVNDGSIYVFFFRDNIYDAKHSEYWIRFIQTLSDQVKYSHTQPKGKNYSL